MLSSVYGSLTPVSAAVGLFIAYNIGLIIYRLFFHPLRNFPGPKLNAATLWVDFYYDVYLGGQMTFKLKDWHDQYGPIVRINPDELHILDSEFYEEIYTSASRPRDKWAWFIKSSGTPNSLFTTIPHDLHRLRRGLFSSYFSKKTIVEDALPIVKSKVAKLRDRLRKSAQTGDIIRMDTAFTALTLDIITRYSLDTDSDYLDEDDFHKIWQDSMKAGIRSMGIGHHFGWIFDGLVALPEKLMLKIAPEAFGQLIASRERIKVDVEKIWFLDEGKTQLRDASSMPRRSLIHAIRDATHVSYAERTPDRVIDEACLLLAAGSETTAHMLSITCYYLLRNPDVLSALQTEIAAAIPSGKSVSDIDHATLEHLPYFSAVISEGLRMSHGVIARLPRVISPSSNEKLKYKNWDIPKSAVFSMASYYVITDPTIFPDPHSFQPERWLLPTDSNSSDATSKWKFNTSMNKYLTNFGKGSRACLGINLSYVEMYTTLAMLATQALGPDTEVGMELYEVDFDRDIKIAHEFFTAFPSMDSKGIRMKSRAKDEGSPG